jgi:hypothetical protein
MKNFLALGISRVGLLAVLTWTIPPGAIDGFRIYRADSISAPFTQVGAVAGTVSTFTDAAGGVGNCWRVTAFNSTGESQPSNNGCLLLVVPSAPPLAVKP